MTAGGATFRVAIIGCGRMGSRFHAPAFAAQPDFRIVACASRALDKATALAQTYGATAYADATELLEREDPDVVVITTAEGAHLEPLAAALAAGRHVFVEKPLHAARGQEWVSWEDHEQAAAVLAGWDRDRSLVGVNFNYRTMPHLRQLKADIESGALGTIRLVDASAHLNCWSHTVDVLRWCCGDVSEVFAHWPLAEERFERTVSLRFASGAIGTLVGARYDFRDDLFRIEVYGTTARGVIEGLNGSYRRLAEEAPQPDVVWPRKDFGNDLFAPSFRASIDAFCEALRSGRQPSPGGDDALAELAVEAAIHRSATSGQPTTVPRGAPGR